MFHCMNQRRRLFPPFPAARAAAFFLEIAYNIPIDAIVMTREVLPELMSGSGSPVGGMAPLTTRALITV